MCLTNCVRRHPDNSTTCYKVLIQNGAWYQKKKFTAPFRTYFNYVIGETYNAKPENSYNEFYRCIDIGYFHSFTTLGDAIDFAETFKKCGMEKHSKLVIVECEIPKDTVSYAGNFSFYAMKENKLSYASKAITIKRIINFK